MFSGNIFQQIGSLIYFRDTFLKYISLCTGVTSVINMEILKKNNIKVCIEKYTRRGGINESSNLHRNNLFGCVKIFCQALLIISTPFTSS